MKKLFIALLIGGLFILACDDYEVIPGVSSFTNQSIRTIAVDPFTLIVTGVIDSLGDGIMEYGHVWTDNTSAPPVITDSKSVINQTILSPGEFSQELPQSLEYNTNYFVRSYAIDVHGRIYYGDPTISFERARTFQVLVDGIPSNALSLGNKLPILALSDNTYIISATSFLQIGFTNRIYKYDKDGNKLGFEVVEPSVLDQCECESPYEMIEHLSELVVIDESSNDPCFLGANTFDLNSGEIGNMYDIKESFLYDSENCVKIIPSPLAMEVILVVCTGMIHDSSSANIFLKETNKSGDQALCDEVPDSLGREIAKDAILGNSNEILIAGIDQANNSELILAIGDAQTGLISPNKIRSGYFDFNDFHNITIGKTPNASTPYLIVGNKGYDGGIYALPVNSDLSFGTLIENINGAILNDAIILDDGSFVAAGSKDGSAYIAKFRPENSTFVLEWERGSETFEPADIRSIDQCQDGGYVASGSTGKILHIIKTDRTGNIY